MSSPSDGPIRLGGLISGFDTESIVKQLLGTDQRRIDKLKETTELNTAKIDTWNDVTTQLKSLAGIISKLKADGTGSNTLSMTKP